MLYLVKTGKITAMTNRVTESAYRKHFQKKVKAARVLSEMEPLEIANLLGISEDQYTRYESRYMMRHDLIIPFCKITGTTLAKLMAPPKVSAKKSIKSA